MKTIRILGRVISKVVSAVGFLAFFTGELVRSSLRVAHDVVTPADRHEPAIVCIPLDVRTDMEITLLANLITLTPGTVALGLSDDGRTMMVHAMFAPDDDQLREEIKTGYESRVRRLLS